MSNYRQTAPRHFTLAIASLAMLAIAATGHADTVPREIRTSQKTPAANDSALRPVDLSFQQPNPQSPGRITGIAQVNHFATGFDDLGQPLAIPSIDPAGVYYSAQLSSLLIVDSEITEVPPVFDLVAATLFATPAAGGVTLADWDLSQITGVEPFRNRESTGITYCETDGHYYVTNDDLDLIFRYAFDGSSFIVVDFVATNPLTGDPEGITCDPVSGRLFVIGGVDANIVVYDYQAGFVLVEELDLEQTAGDPAGQLDDAEGIAFDPVSRHLFVMSNQEDTIVEYRLDGSYVNHFEIDDFSPPPIQPQGLSIGPATTDPDRMSFYIADGGVDNDQDPEERDGSIYEAIIQR